MPPPREMNLTGTLRRRKWKRFSAVITTVDMPAPGVPDLLLPVKIYSFRWRRASFSWRGQMPPVPEAFQSPYHGDEYPAEVAQSIVGDEREEK